MIPLFLPNFRRKGWLAAFLLVGYPFIAYTLFYGGLFGLPVIDTARWGALLLTLVISGVGIVASLPVAVLLALGRCPRMPVVGSAERRVGNEGVRTVEYG